MLLTKATLADCERQMFNKARDIDVALFNYVTSQMPNDFVLYALSMYQNKDGGFGHGLDNDNLNPNSTCYQTFKALEYLYIAGFTNYNENEELASMLNHTFNYLYNRLTVWSSFDEANKKFACSATYQEKENEFFLDTHITGMSLYFLDNKKAYFKKAVEKSKKLLEDLNNIEISFNNLYGYKILFNGLDKSKTIYDEKYKELFYQKVDEYFSSFEINDKNYDQILMIMDDKTKFNDKIDLALKTMMKELKPHGLWETTTEWNNNYPEAESAKLKWLGSATVMNIYLLTKFKEIEE